MVSDNDGGVVGAESGGGGGGGEMVAADPDGTETVVVTTFPSLSSSRLCTTNTGRGLSRRAGRSDRSMNISPLASSCSNRDGDSYTSVSDCVSCAAEQGVNSDRSIIIIESENNLGEDSNDDDVRAFFLLRLRLLGSEDDISDADWDIMDDCILSESEYSARVESN